MTSPATRCREAVWEREIAEHGVVTCFWLGHEPWAGECRGHLQNAHLIPVQTLKFQRSNMDVAPQRYPADDGRHNLLTVTVDDLIADPRNAAPACYGHHTAFDGKRIPLPYLPDGLLEFAAFFGLDHKLPLTRDHREEAAA